MLDQLFVTPRLARLFGYHPRTKRFLMILGWFCKIEITWLMRDMLSHGLARRGFISSTTPSYKARFFSTLDLVRILTSEHLRKAKLTIIQL